MSVLVFEHWPTEGPAAIGAALRGQGHLLRTVRLHAGEPVPVDLDDVDGIVSMGGPMNVDEVSRHPWLGGEMEYLKKAHEVGVPIVGVCLGAQLIGAALGGQVGAMPVPEVGWGPVKLVFPGTVDPLLAGIGWETVQFHLHGQEVKALPAGGVTLASSKACKNQAFRVGLKTYGFQYHFEWDREDLAVAAQDGLVAKAGASAGQIVQQAATYYEAYRRLGDRLCRSIAMLLFPIDKR
jgi:GMP synthase-like glutamine amidotransferase